MSGNDLNKEVFYDDGYRVVDEGAAKAIIDDIHAVEHYEYRLSRDEIEALLNGKVILFTVNANEYSFVIGLKT